VTRLPPTMMRLVDAAREVLAASATPAYPPAVTP